jgi:hypothetical protein
MVVGAKLLFVMMKQRSEESVVGIDIAAATDERLTGTLDNSDAEGEDLNPLGSESDVAGSDGIGLWNDCDERQ